MIINYIKTCLPVDMSWKWAESRDNLGWKSSRPTIQPRKTQRKAVQRGLFLHWYLSHLPPLHVYKQWLLSKLCQENLCDGRQLLQKLTCCNNFHDWPPLLECVGLLACMWRGTHYLPAKTIVKLRQGSGKDRQRMAVKAKGLKA